MADTSTLPDGWEETVGSELFTFYRGVTFKKADVSTTKGTESIAILRAGNIQDGQLVFDDLVYVGADKIKSEQLIRKGDLVVAMSSGSKAVVGKVATAKSDFPDVAFGAFCGLLRPRSGVERWLSAFFQTKRYRNLVSSLSKGVNINNLKKDHLCSMEMPLPPLSEQRRIADKIDALQAKSRRAREALETVGPLLEKFRQSVLAAAFRGDLTAEWRKQHPDVEPAEKLLERIRTERRARWEEAELAKMRAKGTKPKNDKWKAKYTEPESVDATGLPELPEGWCWAALEQLKGLEDNAMTDGPFGSKLKTSDYSESGARVVRLGNVGVGHFVEENKAYVPEEKYDELQKHHIFAGDLVIAALAEPVGRCCVVPETLGPALVKADCIRFVPHIECSSIWLMNWLNSPQAKQKAESKCHGLGRLRINMGNMRKLPIPLCPSDEQNQIRKLLTNVQGYISGVEDVRAGSLVDFDSLDQSILAKAFRGELVPQDSNDEPASVLLERIKAERESWQGKKRTRRKKK